MKVGFRFPYLLAFGVLLAGCGAGSESTASSDADSQQPDLIEQADTPSDAAEVAPAAATAASDEVSIDENAVVLLKGMTSTVAGLSEFAVTLEMGFDVLQPTGQKLEFGSRRDATIRRPDRARFNYEKRSGFSGELVFDGSDIYQYSGEENVYASIEQPGDIDPSLDLVTDQLNIAVPAADFFASDPAASLAQGVLEARDLGPSTINGQPGRQIALRKPGVDYQIWVSDATSLPMRVVITYLEDPGQPQFWAQFLSWDTAATKPDDFFEFSPPDGAERIRFALPDTSEEIEGEAP